ncbi:Cell division protein ZapA [Candidatus Westeberhardia cardiocondylae]|uniref:Cell division protein ZapA n=1 Tax=Candidatus Westeberhardia cardiocondylae TaxID=1594731 RepID=A0A0H5C5N2_9ENTR|nr:cell division protein ZapA [Candidatus Westeberhardia cardiocondylae]MCR3756279.1 cell division protein ZapA [Candidatus Westeberhardia cardiocondylae]CEN32271.1 Cell division protein ZapA [Candidatus Westeberhardia cardiocondylae]
MCKDQVPLLQSVEVQIFGRTLRVNCPLEHKSELDQAAEDINKRLYDLKIKNKAANTEHLMFIVALNISHELIKEKLKVRNYVNDMKKYVCLLHNMIDKVLVE